MTKAAYRRIEWIAILALVAVSFTLIQWPTAQARTQASPQGGLGESEETLTGRYFIRWLCEGEDLSSDAMFERAELIDDFDSKPKILDIDLDYLEQYGGKYALDGKRVTITGFKDTSDPAQVRVSVTSIALAPGETLEPSVASGNFRMVVLLVHFQGTTTPDLNPISHYKQEIDSVVPNTYPGLDHYYRQVSANAVNLANSDVFGWYTLPFPRSHYLSGQTLMQSTLTEDAVAKANQVNPSIFFPQYTAICVVTSDRAGGFNLTGSVELPADLPSPPTYPNSMKRYHEIYLLPPATIEAWAHEIGHAMGMRHSGSMFLDHENDGQTDSQYDVMSGFGACTTVNPQFGCPPVEPIADNKARAGFLPASRLYTAAWNSVSPPIWIERLGNPSPPSPTTQYLWAKIPVGGSPNTTTFYTVEARRFTGTNTYENQLPGEGVIIHLSRLGGTPRVVDADTDNTVSNDPGSRWIPGEVYSDCTPNNQVRIEVLTAGATGYQVRISTGSMVGICPPPSSDGGMELGQEIAVQTPANNYLAAGDSQSLSLTGSITVEAWVRLRLTNVHHGVVSKRKGGANGGGYELRIDGNNRLVFETYANGNSGTPLASYTAPNLTLLLSPGWHHVSGSYDSVQKKIRISIDGTVWTSTAFPTNRSPQDGNSPLYIGRKGNMNHYMRGRIDLVRISRVVKYTANFSPVTNYSYDTDSVALWRFDDSVRGPTALDSVPFSASPAAGNNTLTRYGSPLPVWTTGVTIP